MSVRRYYTKGDLAEIAGCSTSTIRSWIRAGIVPHALPPRECVAGPEYAYTDEHVTAIRSYLAFSTRRLTINQYVALRTIDQESRAS